MINEFSRMNNSSLSIVPTLSSTPKMISLKICKNYDRNNGKYVDMRDNLTYDQLKQEICKQVEVTLLPTEFCLSIFNVENNSWQRFDGTNLSDKSIPLRFRSHSILNIEKLEHMNERCELCLILCRQPKCISDTIHLTIQSSVTLGQLKERARKMVTNQETHNLYVQKKYEWLIFGKTLDGQSLAELDFVTNSVISFGTKDDPFPGVCGLTNLGNTCFMNSALQCLSNVPSLTQKILSFDETMNAPVISAYVNLIRTIWSGEYTNTKPSSLLINIREDLPHFTKYRQHDAQEFMNYFLHLIHQELTNERTVITRLFHGQVQSSVRCLHCDSLEINEETISFLPLSMSNDVNQYDIIYLGKYGEQRSISICSNATTVGALIESFIRQYYPKLLPTQIKPVKIVDNYVMDEYFSCTHINDRIKSCLAFIEVPEKTNDKKHLQVEFIEKTTRKCFRPPLFLMGPSYNCRYAHIVEQINQIQAYFCSITNAPTSAFKLYRVDSDLQYLHLSSERNLNELLYYSDKLVVEIDSQYVDVYKNHVNIEYKPRDASLNTLLEDFFREESLNGDYYCSKCQGLTRAKQKADFTLPLPPVLIIQLKRFPFDVHSSSKIDTFIDFPLKDLNLGKYIAENYRNGENMLASYDLVAVSNHTGTLTYGHYTTYAKNYQNQKWYSFNDDLTREINDERDIVTKNAYILVYVHQTVS